MGEDEGELRQQIERLYALPPGAFTAARQELAARLRREGRRQDAAAVKALRRPTPAAWAVGRLLRLEPQRFKEMLEAGRQARQAQRSVLAGKGASSEAATGALRESLSTAKRLVEELRRRGLELLGGAARPPTAAIADRLTADLQALAYTAGAEQALAPGWLDHDLEAPGFEVMAGLQAAAGARAAAARKGPARRPAPPEAQRAERAAAKERRPETSVAAAVASGASRRTEERQKARLAAATAAVQRAEEEVAEGRAAAAAAERDAAAAERAAAEAGRRAEQARAEAQRERRRAEQAEEQLRRARERQAAARSTPG
jgi:hypothetical protein